MDQENNIPQLYQFYFRDSAGSAQKGASRRLKKWSRAFDQWIEDRRRKYQKDACKQARLAWRRFARQKGKMPWTVSREDIDEHSTWMEQEGFAASTINCSIGMIADFYQWCDYHQVDASCKPGFNPAKEARRFKIRRYEGACIWSREEVEGFLDLLKRDGSELGKRDYAYFVARISLGVPLKHLQQLGWGQLEVDEVGARVRWRSDGKQMRLPNEVWQAISEYLRVSGRLEGMEAGKYIFTGLATPGRESTGGKAEDWLEQRPLSNSGILSSLKLYGRKLGINNEKLTMMALRRTAVRLRLEEGESLEGMKAFMDSREEVKSTRYRLGKLPELPEESTIFKCVATEEVTPPVRKAKPYKEGDNTTHGIYRSKRDKEAVKAVLKENIQGMEAEIECLRRLMRGLLDWEGDEARLAEGYSKAAQRLAMLLATEVPAEKGEKNSWAEEVLERMDEVFMSRGMPPFSTGVLEKVYGSQSGDIGARSMVAEEVATCRLLLRNVYRRAMQGVGADEYVRLVDLYGMGCVRLTRLIKIGGGDGDDRLAKYLNDMLDKALRQFTIKYRLDKEN